MTTTSWLSKFCSFFLSVGLLLYAGCAEESGTPGPTASVAIKQIESPETKAPVPGQRAELYIDNALKGQSSSPNPDGGVTFTDVSVPPGTRTFMIRYYSTYTSIKAGVQEYVVAEATKTDTIDAGVGKTITLDPPKAVGDKDNDGSTNLSEIRAGTDPDDALSKPNKAIHVSTGAGHSCAVTDTNDIWCWGTNEAKQLGDRNIPAIGSRVPNRVPGIIGNAKFVAAGGLRTCAVLLNNNVVCWGMSGGGLGDGTKWDEWDPVPVANVTDVYALANGNFHSCAIVGGERGSARCWGSNERGQLGDNDLNNANTRNGKLPQPVVSPTGSGMLTDLVSIAVGEEHSCATQFNGTVYCWGRNEFGQLGNGKTTPPLTPNKIPTQTGDLGFGVTPTSVAAGAHHTCVRANYVPNGDGRVMGNVRCWGRNNKEDLALDVGTGNQSAPATTRFSAATDLLLGTEHTCIQQTTGAVACAGGNGSGQLGDGTTGSTAARGTPLPIANFAVQSLGAAAGSGAVGGGAAGGGGKNHTCALVSGGGVRCWGANGKGQLGNNSITDSGKPERVVGFE